MGRSRSAGAVRPLPAPWRNPERASGWVRAARPPPGSPRRGAERGTPRPAAQSSVSSLKQMIIARSPGRQPHPGGDRRRARSACRYDCIAPSCLQPAPLLDIRRRPGGRQRPESTFRPLNEWLSTFRVGACSRCSRDAVHAEMPLPAGRRLDRRSRISRPEKTTNIRGGSAPGAGDCAQRWHLPADVSEVTTLGTLISDGCADLRESRTSGVGAPRPGQGSSGACSTRVV
jgi:hypothetical protein